MKPLKSDRASQRVRFRTARVATPIGSLRYAARAGRLYAVGFEDGWDRLEDALARRFGALELVEGEVPSMSRAFRDYFEGEDPDALAGVPTHAHGTPFQRRVWSALARIPRGQTWSYAELAQRVGRPRAWRAVGAANGSNPTSLVIPCHRVIAADGAIGGYAFGTERKRWLLEHEGAFGRGRDPRPRVVGRLHRDRLAPASATD